MENDDMTAEVLQRKQVVRSLKKAFPKKLLQRTVNKLLSVSGYDGAELSILFTNDREIQTLNRRYRKKNKPTDVLSFPLLEGPGARFAGNALGDVVISVPTARRQAKRQGISLQEEIIRLIIHGFLHLLGYDHENVSKQEAERMKKREKLLLKKLA
jgi:probable rRNA maturation factor